jgi:hypothetical protein
MYFAVWKQNVYCHRILLFYGWVVFICSLLTCYEPVKQELVKKPSSAPSWLNSSFNFIQLIILVPAGWYWTGALYLTHWAATSNIRDERDKAKAQTEAPKPA